MPLTLSPFRLLYTTLLLLPSLTTASLTPSPSSPIPSPIQTPAKDLAFDFNPATLFNTSTPLGAAIASFLGESGNPTVQNELLRGIIGGGRNGTTMQCPEMSVIFARGTAEPGNVGILTGPPFFAALGAYMNNTSNGLAIQGVDYPASVKDFLAGGSVEGARVMAGLVNSTLHTCPQTHLLLSGYSQGAQLVHLATSLLPNTTTAQISSIILFGDPLNGTALSGIPMSRVLSICHSGDVICNGNARGKGTSKAQGERDTNGDEHAKANANANAGFPTLALATGAQRGTKRRGGLERWLISPDTVDTTTPLTTTDESSSSSSWEDESQAEEAAEGLKKRSLLGGIEQIGQAHLNYSGDAGAAAMFALSGVAMLGITSAKMVLGNTLG